jgi:hypothetical protein
MSYIFGRSFGNETNVWDVEGSLEPETGADIFVDLPQVAENLAKEVTKISGCEDFLFQKADGLLPALSPSESLVCRTFAWVSQNGYTTEEIWKSSMASNISHCAEDFMVALRQKFSQECRGSIEDSARKNWTVAVCFVGALALGVAAAFSYKKLKKDCSQNREREALLNGVTSSAYSTDIEL